jgi:rsbT co-antagonist protein RsbR
VVDTQVANALLRAAQAVSLLGAQVVLTGIRPEVAQTIVGLGVSLQSVVTRSSLQSGIAYAMNGRALS